MSILDQAIKEIEHDYKSYKRYNNLEKMRISEYILRTLYKQKISPIPKEYYKENKCYDCGSETQQGNYCNVCGKRLI